MRNAIKRILALVALMLTGGTAMSDVHTVLDPEQRIITNNDLVFDLFNPTELVVTAFTPPGGIGQERENTMRLSFRELGGAPIGLITGNLLPLFPPTPFATPSLLGVGNPLLQEGTWLDVSRQWLDPVYEIDSGIVEPASYGQSGSQGDFDLLTFEDGDVVLIGYAKSDKSMFGYVQIGTGIDVSMETERLPVRRFRCSASWSDSLCPGSGSLLALGAAGLLVPSRRR
ncbi:MAG: hypothetical protein KF705_09130 [Phycisphaeraceae bacterium]|nr:hypothetical protein [Phycisphaeraceae bacterium]